MIDFKPWANGNWKNDEEAEMNFLGYFHQHYKPLLDKIADSPYPKIDLTEKEKTLLGYLRDDLTKIFETAYNSM